MLDQHHRLRFPGVRVAAHSRRVGRHSRQGETHRIRPISEEAQNRAGRHVTFHYIAFDQSGMTRFSPIRHTVFRFESGQLRILTEIDVGSKILQVPDPLSATPSAGVLVHLEGETGERALSGRNSGRGRGRRRRGHRRSAGGTR